VGRAAKSKGKGELTLVGGARPKAQKPRRNSWTKAKERDFLSTLAETCNVTLSAEAAGMSVTSAYNRRKSHAAFRAGWAEALSAAYQRLELLLLDRALNGTEKIVRRKDGSEERMRDYSNQTALALLRMHRDSAVEAIEEPSESEVAEVRKRLVEKLERLKVRFEQEKKKKG